MTDKQTKYSTSGLTEAESEPGSGGEVLRNLQGITTRHEMEFAETLELACVIEDAIDSFGPDHRFTAADLCKLHQQWFGTIYSWAGSYRQVMMSKSGFCFAAPAHIPALMNDFETSVLARYTPCQFTKTSDITLPLAVVHVELVLIHPFREGNGRLARLLTTLMALQSGLPILEFSLLDAERERYFTAVRAGMDRNYGLMQQLFNEVIKMSVSRN